MLRPNHQIQPEHSNIFLYTSTIYTQSYQPSNLMDFTYTKKVGALLVPLNFNLPTGRISKNSFTVGRSPTCDLVLTQSYISHVHITIYRRSQGRGQEYTVVVNSKNKVYLNSTAISDSKNRLLKNNDQIWLVHRSMVPNCRQIGFVFKTEDINQNWNIVQKYGRELNALETFAAEIKQLLRCTRCNSIMPAPINLQPCSHKVCETCALWMIENLADKCPDKDCNKKVVILMEDSSFNSVLTAYNRYKFGSAKTNKSHYFAETPYLMQKWIKTHRKKSETKQAQDSVPKSVQNSTKVNQSPPNSARNQKQQQPKITKKSAYIFKAVSGIHFPRINFNEFLQIKKVEEQNPASKEELTDQDFEQLRSELKELQTITEAGLIQEPQIVWKDSQSQTQRQESTLQSNQTQSKKFQKMDCCHCKKSFPFLSPKSITEMQCQICTSFFCNKQFPPCKNGDQPLRSLSQRLRIISKENVLSIVQQKVKRIVCNKLLSSIRQLSQLGHLFKSVLVRSGESYNYFLVGSNNQIKRYQITIASCVCDQCWRSLARQMLLSFLKYHQSKLRMFSRKDIEEVVAEVKKQSLK